MKKKIEIEWLKNKLLENKRLRSIIENRTVLKNISVCFLALLVIIAVVVVVNITKVPDVKRDTKDTEEDFRSDVTNEETSEDSETEITDPPITDPDTEETTAVETEPTILDELADLYAKNSDLAGWIHIEGTVVDYPVMFTPYDAEKYLRKNFDGTYNINGLPFIDANCSVYPESDNLIIYGHNMTRGRMFAALLNYAEEDYWKEHPIIEFSTLYENRKYEIIAAFYDKVYKKSDTCFKFYKFINAESEDAFCEAMDYYKSKACYETGVNAEYGDSLITLVTCSNHDRNGTGRFVVVARQITQ